VRCGGEGIIVRDTPAGVGPKLISYCRECGNWVL